MGLTVKFANSTIRPHYCRGDMRTATPLNELRTGSLQGCSEAPAYPGAAFE